MHAIAMNVSRTCQCRANMARIRQSSPDSGLGLSHFECGAQGRFGGMNAAVSVETASPKNAQSLPCDATKHPESCIRDVLLSSGYGSYKTVKARFWLWLSGRSPQTLAHQPHLFVKSLSEDVGNEVEDAACLVHHAAGDISSTEIATLDLISTG